MACNDTNNTQMQLHRVLHYLDQRGKLGDERQYEVGLDLRDCRYDIKAAARDARELKKASGESKTATIKTCCAVPDADGNGGVCEGLGGVEEEDVEQVVALQHARVELNNKRGLDLGEQKVGRRLHLHVDGQTHGEGA